MAKTFNADHLPPKLRFAFSLGPLGWWFAVQVAKDHGITNVDFVTDMVFHMHHPERNGSPISSGEKAAIKEWVSFRGKVKSSIGASSGGSSGGSSSKPSTGTSAPADRPELLDLLLGVDTKLLGASDNQRSHLLRLQSFLIDAIDGYRIDDRYWQYSYIDGLGREYPCSRQGTVHRLNRGMRQNAFKNFKRMCESASTPKEVGKQLMQLESTISCYIDVVGRWAHHNSAIGDASIIEYTECRWIMEMYNLSRQSRPKSVYWCFKWTIEGLQAPCS